MSELDLFALDRAVRAAELAAGRAPEHRAPGMTEETFGELRALAASDPLAEALEPWLFRRLELAALAPARQAVEHAYRTARHVLQEPEDTQEPLSAMLAQALADDARRGAYLRGFFANASELSDTTLRLWEARAELATRLGVELDRYELGLPTVAAHAASWLELSQDAFSELAVRDPARFVTLGLAEDAQRGWPAHLSPRSLSDLLEDGRWFDGLRLRVPALPYAYGAASFLRGLALLGRALADAATSERVPFACACDLLGSKRQSQAALFAYLPLLPSFLQKKLGLGPAHVTDTLRALARSVLLESRAAALRVLLRAPLLAGAARLRGEVAELSTNALGFELPSTAALAFVRVHRDDAQRFTGMLLAAARAEQLLQAHDDDWYRNPRAVSELRQELEQPAEPRATNEQLSSAARELHALLSRRI